MNSHGMKDFSLGGLIDLHPLQTLDAFFY